MATVAEYNRFGEDIEKLMLLRTSPLAVKMLQKESDVPEGALKPKAAHGGHLAQCQAFSISRRKGEMIAMLKDDNWCWGPLLAYGLVEPGIAEKFPELREVIRKIPLLDYGRYVGIVSAPLKTANFLPDVVLIYSNNAQLNNMLYALSFAGEGLVNSPIFPIASCAFSVVPALSGQCCITLPDPGELGRAQAGEDEIIFSLPQVQVPGLVSQLRMFEERKMGYRHNALWEIMPDFPRPDFYKKFYRECGLKGDDVPTWPAR
jgi:uncharacterized protein (DUF169 family)